MEGRAPERPRVMNRQAEPAGLVSLLDGSGGGAIVVIGEAESGNTSLIAGPVTTSCLCEPTSLHPGHPLPKLAHFPVCFGPSRSSAADDDICAKGLTQRLQRTMVSIRGLWI